MEKYMWLKMHIVNQKTIIKFYKQYDYPKVIAVVVLRQLYYWWFFPIF